MLSACTYAGRTASSSSTIPRQRTIYVATKRPKNVSPNWRRNFDGCVGSRDSSFSLDAGKNHSPSSDTWRHEDIAKSRRTHRSAFFIPFAGRIPGCCLYSRFGQRHGSTRHRCALNATPSATPMLAPIATPIAMPTPMLSRATPMTVPRATPMAVPTPAPIAIHVPGSGFFDCP